MAVHDCKSVYHVPLLLHSQGFLDIITKKLHLSPRADPLCDNLFIKWKQLTNRIDRLQDTVKIVLVGKYTHLHDSYMSVIKSLEHAALSCNKQVEIEWVEASDIESSAANTDPIKYHNAWARICASK